MLFTSNISKSFIFILEMLIVIVIISMSMVHKRVKGQERTKTFPHFKHWLYVKGSYANNVCTVQVL